MALESNRSHTNVEDTLLALVATRGPGKTICPSEVARAIAGEDPQRWSKLMPSIREAAVRLAHGGQISIMRKGKPVDPDDFRGVYRLGTPPGRSHADMRGDADES